MEYSENLKQLAGALPQSFEFYNLGQVSLTESTQTFPTQDCTAIGFRLYGDVTALLILLFPLGLDVSLYSEMGNILASRIANQLTSHNKMEVMVSPPSPISEDQFEQLIRRTTGMIRRSYVHLYKSTVIPVETVILPSPSEGTGYA
jgi:hypothetical protein